MKTTIKKFLKNILPAPLLACLILIINKNSYLYTTGWMQSLKHKKPIDAIGNPIPWMNFPAISFLKERLTQDLTLFEFGSGYSTFFYATKVKAVTSVEYDEKWFDIVKPKIPENVDLILKEKDVDGDYCRVIGTMKNYFDVVIVDGRDRVNCVKQSISALSSRGVIILDDSQRYEYQEAINFAKMNGFKALHFEGIKATGSGIDRTTFLYRRDNCFDI